MSGALGFLCGQSSAPGVAMGRVDRLAPSESAALEPSGGIDAAGAACAGVSMLICSRPSPPCAHIAAAGVSSDSRAPTPDLARGHARAGKARLNAASPDLFFLGRPSHGGEEDIAHVRRHIKYSPRDDATHDTFLDVLLLAIVIPAHGLARAPVI